MALTTPTTAASAVTAGDQFVNVTSATGVTAGMVGRIDKEYFLVGRDYVSGTQIPMNRRGDQGSAQVAHQILAPIVFGLPSDFPNPPLAQAVLDPPTDLPVITISVDTTLSSGSAPPLPVVPTKILIDKATACAIVLPAPSAAMQEGAELWFLSMTAAAHTVTYTPGFYGDTTSSDVATFAAKAGASFKAFKYKGAWGVTALTNVTLG
ncbi:MAG TPA: hypothetical protein VK504_06090 [Vicinamibacterales bacterium]|nr:hypothetical protein [Vicinamibacterales bacterium]